MSDVKWPLYTGIVNQNLKAPPPPTHTPHGKKMNGPITRGKLVSWTFQIATISPVRHCFIGKHLTVLWVKAHTNCLCDWPTINKDFLPPWGLWVASSSPLEDNMVNLSGLRETRSWWMVWFGDCSKVLQIYIVYPWIDLRHSTWTGFESQNKPFS